MLGTMPIGTGNKRKLNDALSETVNLNMYSKIIFDSVGTLRSGSAGGEHIFWPEARIMEKPQKVQ
jgi:hypothetical protein